MAVTKRVVRKHVVRAELTNVELVKAKSALRLEVFAAREKLGELEVGRGSIYWRGANRYPQADRLVQVCGDDGWVGVWGVRRRGLGVLLR